jgi:hypothetical protein
MEDVAPQLPDAVQEEAVAAVRALVEEGQQPVMLCKLAAAMAAQRQREVYDQALAVARHIENRQARVVVLAELCEHMPADQRATLAEEGWETLNEITSARQQQDDIEWRLRALIALIQHLPDDLAGRAAREAVEIVKGQPDSECQHWGGLLQRALERREATPEADSRQARPTDKAGQPQTIFQCDLRSIRLLTRMCHEPTSTTLAEVRECLEAVESARAVFAKDGHLRQLIRCQTHEMSSEVTAELLGAVKTTGSEPLYVELSEHLTGVAKSSVLCQGLVAEKYRPGRDASLKMVAAWQEKQFDPDVGRSLFPSLLADASNRQRYELMDDLSAMIPLMAHLYGRSLVDATFKGLQDVTAWWP